jgi:hypothetical protein
MLPVPVRLRSDGHLSRHVRLRSDGHLSRHPAAAIGHVADAHLFDKVGARKGRRALQLEQRAVGTQGRLDANDQRRRERGASLRHRGRHLVCARLGTLGPTKGLDEHVEALEQHLAPCRIVAL